VTAVVTGLGALTPLGPDAESLHRGLLAATSGVGLLEGGEFDALPTRLAATVARENVEGRLERTAARTVERVQHLALIAAREAWEQAKAQDVTDPARVAVVLGTAVGGIAALPGQTLLVEEHGPRRVSPYLMSALMPNASAASVALHLGVHGGARTTASACASGAEAVAFALELLETGQADVVIAGGAESCVHPMTLAGFAQLRALSRRVDEPASASRPFDTARDGFVLGEGAAVLVLERPEHAAARGAEVLGRVLGAGITSDAHHLIAPDPEGAQAARSIGLALRAAGLTPADIGHVSSHGTATPAGDLAEARALNRALGGERPPVTAVKSCTGHLLGASGAVEAVAALLALRDGVVAPIRNLDDPDPGADLDLVTGRPRPVGRGAALSTSFGFGGHNVSLVLAR
jgi:3-oxoacyl-[acyl-carrier-protein] synthase II